MTYFSEKDENFANNQFKSLRQNMTAIEKDPIAKYSFLPYVFVRYLNHRVNYNLTQLTTLDFPFSKTARDEVSNIQFRISQEMFEGDRQELENMLTNHIEYVYGRAEESNYRLEDRIADYRNLIGSFDLMYFSMAAVVGILYILYKEVYVWIFQNNEILLGNAISSLIRENLSRIKVIVLSIMASILVYDFYVIYELSHQKNTYNTNSFLLIFVVFIFIGIIMIFRRNKSKKTPLVFFDTNVVDEDEFLKLKELVGKGEIKLETSRKVAKEINDFENTEKKKKLESRIESIDTVPDLFSFRGGGASFPMKFVSEEDEERFSRVLEIVFGMSPEQFANDMRREKETAERIERDAKNLEAAIRDKADYFLTSDKGHILSKRQEIKKEFGIKARTLAEFLGDLESKNFKRKGSN